MYGNTATSFAAMLEHGIGQGSDLRERETGSLGEKTDSPFVDVAAETEGSGNSFLGGAAGESYSLVGPYADDVIARVVDG